MQLEEILQELQHGQHLVRSQGQTKLKGLLEEKRDDVEGLEDGIISMLTSENALSRLGGFLTAAITIPYFAGNVEFTKRVQQACIQNLESAESRIRYAVGDCLGVLAKELGGEMYSAVSSDIHQSIIHNYERENNEPEPVGNEDPLECLLQTSYRVREPGKGELRHGTEGWKSLETSFRSLLKIIEGMGSGFEPFVDRGLWDLVCRGTTHPNRFVREISYFTVGALIGVSLGGEGNVKRLGAVVGKGLSDDWSQVRYAGSVAARRLMTTHPPPTYLFPAILPQMCLNRYYVADGVRLYSQETWKLVVGMDGCMFVSQSIQAFVEYYIKQCAANNHAVREASCSCIAELMVKIDKGAVAPFVPNLIQSLINCFKDASWPVRDAACCACGKAVRSFPEQTKEAMDELYTLWLAHLSDNIASVREDSAVALVDVVHAHDQTALDRILPEIRVMILEARNQKEDAELYKGLTNVTYFGVARPKIGDDVMHTDQTMFSCGSLAPKLERGGGCMDHGFKREKEPWEVSDGAVYFLRELSNLRPDACQEFLPSIAELVRLQGFQHVHALRRTVWKAMTVMAKNLGKRTIKQYLSEFLTPLFRAVHSGNQLEEAAAADAVLFFCQFLGEGIFRGRLNQEQNRLLTVLRSE